MTRSQQTPHRQMLYRQVFDRVLTRTDAETVHHAAFAAIRAAGTTARLVAPRRPAVRVMGLEFPEILGVAAGFDKNAAAIDGLAALGFGFVEVGTITGEAQPGNPRPRLHRLPADRAIINRMGFNNDGAEVVARRLARRLERGPFPVPVGINIGKTKVVPEDAAIGDYEKSTTLLAAHADYLVVNVSSPNTPGLRDLQAVEKLEPLLRAVRHRADGVSTRHVPLLVKIAPDLADDDVLVLADLATAVGLDGIVATNTTTSRDGLRSGAEGVARAGAGGLSGQPVRQRAGEVVRLLRGRVDPEMTIIGVGGITTVDDAQQRLEDGADLVQAYTGFVYEGPLWPRRVNAALCGKKGWRR